MHSQRWRDQKQQRRLRRKLRAWKISVLLKLASLMMPQNARPIVQSLQWEMDIFVCFQLQNGKASSASAGEDINHRSVAGGKRRDLRVDVRWIQPRVDRSYSFEDQRLQPALRIHAPQRVAAVAIFVASFVDDFGKFRELRLDFSGQPRTVTGYAEDRFFFHIECSGYALRANSCELQAM